MEDRFLFIPCETEADLIVVWDRIEKCVFDVLDQSDASHPRQGAYDDMGALF